MIALQRETRADVFYANLNSTTRARLPSAARSFARSLAAWDEFSSCAPERALLLAAQRNDLR
jgi:hypothetical protein